METVVRQPGEREKVTACNNHCNNNLMLLFIYHFLPSIHTLCYRQILLISSIIVVVILLTPAAGDAIMQTEITEKKLPIAQPKKGTSKRKHISSDKASKGESKSSALKVVHKKFFKPQVVIPRNPSVSVEDMYRRLVFVSAFSDNHFKEAREMLRTVTECLPETTIIIYDLGLNKYTEELLARYKNVEIRPFPFYAFRPHVRNLLTYAWKPLIVKQVSREYDFIMYGDSSVRLISCNITAALEHLLEFPFFGNPIYSKAVEFAHDGMIRYLQFPKRRRDMKDVASVMGGCWLMWATYEMKQRLIFPWADCAIEEECIAPFGCQLFGCNSEIINDGRYAGCHRFDQSALNLILAREFGLDHFSRSTNCSIAKSIWAVKRK